ncbi:RNA polymerase sigma-70 factor [Flavobacterium sp. ANB]|uniref:RNA polymerase sigma factor n=1 Tax=unclassified Flavobacterium TaxID=196869 RepID=UPI0012B82722|nr:MULTISPECIES: RNA polymerase sigma-70 factor [unclassified Flavobacterium]MBF4516996.1 RNA polymerase sigma-70 factor [Flavobacterium sp. ANB]MTD69108.1 RNA polymerase sigma-70 factor [Flavobacterium sp. LC2016-13]
MENYLLKMSDDELQKLISQENQEAFAIIFNRYWKRLYTYAFKIYKDEAVCEDIVQEIFISLWKNSGNTVILNLEAYLLRAVKYKIANQIRNLKFDKEQLDVLESIPAPHFTINDIEYIEFEKGIMDQINQLTPKCREVFLLSRVDHFTNAEIAEKLSLSIHTIEKHISNALKQLRLNEHHNYLLFWWAAFFYVN